MASDLNRVVLIGRLTRDPEIRSTASGSYICRFSLANNRSYNRRDSSETVEEVGYFDCVSFGKLAEILSKYLKKGSRIAIDGQLRFSSWETPDQGKRSKVEILIDSFQFLDSRSQEQGGSTVPAATEGQAKPAEPDYYSGSSALPSDDDIPF
jgi:single-strand DNA-binding protein